MGVKRGQYLGVDTIMGYLNGRGSYQYNDWDMVESGMENQEKRETDRCNNSMTMKRDCGQWR